MLFVAKRVRADPVTAEIEEAVAAEDAAGAAVFLVGVCIDAGAVAAGDRRTGLARNVAAAAVRQIAFGVDTLPVAARPPGAGSAVGRLGAEPGVAVQVAGSADAIAGRVAADALGALTVEALRPVIAGLAQRLVALTLTAVVAEGRAGAVLVPLAGRAAARPIIQAEIETAGRSRRRTRAVAAAGVGCLEAIGAGGIATGSLAAGVAGTARPGLPVADGGARAAAAARRPRPDRRAADRRAGPLQSGQVARLALPGTGTVTAESVEAEARRAIARRRTGRGRRRGASADTDRAAKETRGESSKDTPARCAVRQESGQLVEALALHCRFLLEPRDGGGGTRSPRRCPAYSAFVS